MREVTQAYRCQQMHNPQIVPFSHLNEALYNTFVMRRKTGLPRGDVKNTPKQLNAQTKATADTVASIDVRSIQALTHRKKRLHL